MKKIISALLVLMMLLAVAAPALAEEAATGSITINNAVVGQTYKIYRIFDLEEDYDATNNIYHYKVNNTWKSFVNGADIKGKYVTIDEGGFVFWVEGASEVEFAAKAKAYAEDEKNSITAVKSEEATSATVTFDELALGYYLVTSTQGALCGLDTTNPTVTIKEKNGIPEINKEVQEDSTENWGKENDADIGDTVNFRSTITAKDGAQNYVFHDEMDAGLTFSGASSISITLKKKGETTANTVEAGNYTVTEGGTEETNKCTFEVAFTQDFCDTLEADDEIVISYTATLNDKAVVAGTGNSNKSKLTYGEKGKTEWSETKTYTWDMEVLKYADGDREDKLPGAEFVLLNSAKTQVATVVSGKLTGWVDVPTAGNDGTITWPANSVLSTGDGEYKTIEIDGLDADTYYLREIKAPVGYNKLPDPFEVKITGATKGENDTLTYTTVVAEVENNSGTLLPSTGGAGTTIFYVVGGLMVLVAVVLLVTKKKMSSDVNKD